MSKYVFDEMGNRFEGMTREEILEIIGMVDIKVSVFTNSLIYNNEKISYSYVGEKPADNYIIKLLDVALDFNNNLSQSDISILLAIGEFKLFFYLCEAEVYITNGHCNMINIFNSNKGLCTLYLNSKKVSYFMKSNNEINNIHYCTKLEYDNIPHEEDVIYVVEDEDYVVEKATRADYATSAGSAVRAAHDEDGNNIKHTYRKKSNSFAVTKIENEMLYDSSGYKMIELDYSEYSVGVSGVLTVVIGFENTTQYEKTYEIPFSTLWTNIYSSTDKEALITSPIHVDDDNIKIFSCKLMYEEDADEQLNYLNLANIDLKSTNVNFLVKSVMLKNLNIFY